MTDGQAAQEYGTWAREDVAAMIKAYDVRAVVGPESGQLNEKFVAAVGAAFARLMREEGGYRRGCRPRHARKLPGLGKGFF